MSLSLDLSGRVALVTGGGAGIAACCDIRIGTEATRIGFPIARTLGNCLSQNTLRRLANLGND